MYLCRACEWTTKLDNLLDYCRVKDVVLKCKYNVVNDRSLPRRELLRTCYIIVQCKPLDEKNDATIQYVGLQVVENNRQCTFADTLVLIVFISIVTYHT